MPAGIQATGTRRFHAQVRKKGPVHDFGERRPVAVIDESYDTKGWLFNFETGEFICNTDDTDQSGTPYHNY